MKRFDYRKFFDVNRERAYGGVVFFTENQIVERLNSDNGEGLHDEALFDIVDDIFDFRRIKSFNMDDISKVNLFKDKIISDHIYIKLISEYDSHVMMIFFPEIISSQEYDMFKKYCKEIGNEVEEVGRKVYSDDNKREKDFIYDNIILSFDDSMCGVYYSCFDEVLEYANDLIDDDKKVIPDINIIGTVMEEDFLERKRW